jgi:hypothetical protein
MDDHARSLVQHRWQKSAVQPDSGEQIKVERAMPLAIVERREAARWGRRATDDMNDDIDTPQAVPHCICDGRTAFGGSDLSRHKQVVGRVAGPRAGGGEDRRTRLAQPRGHCFADPLGTARD